MPLYLYEGPVFEFDRIVANRWRGETYAISEAKARTNLAFQFKKETGRAPRSKITVPGKIVKKEMSEDERTCVHSELA